MKHLVTSALPYANGPLHFGHIAGAYLPADIYVRHLRKKGETVKFISGSDEHGVAIMLSAKERGIDYKAHVDEWNKTHHDMFSKFGIEFDFFGQTSAKYHEEEVLKWFKEIHEAGFIEPRDNQQLFCKDCKNHLPDRFVEGTCYECGYESARGDECPDCGIWIDSVKLKKPVCKICSSENIEEVTVTQYYLLLTKYYDKYREWFQTKSDWRKAVYPYVDSLTKDGLVDRAITRDLDWGIDVPLEGAEGKKLYVWFDAPIGYVSNLKQHLKESGSTDDYLNDWWNSKDVEITNFIGKDNIIFHAVIFPIMSMVAGRVRPVDSLPANQFLNLEGKQFSKSTGWYVDADSALTEFGQDSLRYYLASISPEASDSNFTWEGFAARVNNELANNIGNFVNRSLKFFAKNWKDGIDCSKFTNFSASEDGQKLSALIKEYLIAVDDKQIKRGIELIMDIGRSANNFFSDREPWAKIKTDESHAEDTIAHSACYAIILGVMFGPYLPNLSSGILSLFGDLITPELERSIYLGDLSVFDKFTGKIVLQGKPKVLIPKIEDDIIKKKNEELHEDLKGK